MHRLKHPFHKVEHDTFWALNDVSFDIEKGDVVGVIGRNGAGKSTLLKILSRITEPTKGQVELYGRVGCLLEVGTGFSSELTGRENIYLNGAILGMQKREIETHFDDIVEFAGVGQFLETPVKRYSSGMYMRLAFAVAAHLNPEILIVDEVLAVGDSEFQKKCLGKMHEVSQSGRTVMLVSHNMSAISLLCNKGLFLRAGEAANLSRIQDTVVQYVNTFTVNTRKDDDPNLRPGTGQYRFISVEPGKSVYGPSEKKEIKFRIKHMHGRLNQAFLSAQIINETGVVVTQCDGRLIRHVLDGQGIIEGCLTLDSLWLKPGFYRVELSICSISLTFTVDKYEDATALTISPVLPYQHSADDEATLYGTTLADFNWRTQPER